MSLSALSLSSSSFATSSEDDYAVSEDLTDTSGSENEGRIVRRKIRDKPNSLQRGVSNQRNLTRDDLVQQKAVSDRFFKKRNRREEFWDWQRPCVKGYEGLVIGDSMLRCFNKIRKKVDGYRISAFGGCELMEMISLIRSGKILKNRDTRDKETRDEILARKLDLPLNLNAPPVKRTAPSTSLVKCSSLLA